MSWSMNGNGTKEAVKRQLGEQKVWGSPTEEEQQVFDETRKILLALVDRVPEAYHGSVTIIRVGAAGHGTNVSSVSMTYEQVALT